MKKYFIHSAVFRLLAPVIFGVILYLLIILINNNVGQIYGILNSEEVYLCIGLTYLSFEGMRIVISILHKRFSTLPYQIPIQLLLTTVLTLAIVWFCLTAYFNIVIGFSISTRQLILFLILFASTSWLYNILFYSNHYLQKENTVKLEMERQQHQVLEMEMKEFTNEINPDLLFEGLESLIGLLYQDIEKAEEHIDNLASTYRYVLTNRKQELVTFESEAHSVKTLLSILNEKFDNKIQFECPPVDESIMAVPGALAIIIEYLVRNTIIPSNEKFVIKGYIEDDEYLAFQCLLNEKLLPHKDSILSLERLQKSYKRFSNNPLIQVKAYKENFIKLPILLLKEETAHFMKVAIVEDEIPAADKLTRYLLKYDPAIEILCTLTSVQQAVQWLAENLESVDIIFMDIQLTDGKSFEIFNQVEINKPVIFTTAFDEYALDAFKVNGIDYLLKPITFSDIEATMHKIKALRAQLTTPVSGQKIKEVFSDGQPKSYKARFMVKYGDHIRSIPTTEIALFFAEGRDVYLVTTNNRKYILDYTLETLEGMLDPKLYFRINRSIIIHIEAIKDVVVYSSSRLKITPQQAFDKEIIVSREKVQAFKEWFDG